ncbi:hypothetical protein T265_09697 [Opisthorchis viverrini]|uniref:Uncharacterized protein n=1 Tax=Opisthorchis viverrini TaxID=6198 RepID=A0A074Z4Z0_OPIVI|nr:hypothetical protein T265_09697 [Opisthorchis viverrini]KER22128.1 hypothetical protein T265_09697 [Opisthorchis viverrini]
MLGVSSEHNNGDQLRLGQPGSIPALVQPSGGIAVRHQKGVTAERLLRQQKLSAAYAQRTGRPLVTETTRDKPRASSQVGCPPRGSSRTRKPQTSRHSSPQTPFLTATTNASKQNAKKRMTHSQRINHASHSLEAALQSTRPVTTLSCDFEWLPPLLYPPDTLFDSSRSTNRMNSSSTRRSQSHSKTVSKPKFPQQCTSTTTTTATTNTEQNYVDPSTLSVDELEQILQRWFQAGYNLGQEHALQGRRKVFHIVVLESPCRGDKRRAKDARAGLADILTNQGMPSLGP